MIAAFITWLILCDILLALRIEKAEARIRDLESKVTP